ATAKAYWEELKPTLSPEEAAHHPARYALAELENIHSPAILVEPIHRAVFGVDPAELRTALRACCGAATESDAQPFTLLTQDGDTALSFTAPTEPLCVGSVDAFLAQYRVQHPALRVDYIHGEDALRRLCNETTVGFLLPPFDKNDLFRGVYLGGVLPRKTFSMGHAEEKRYYLESRKITR
ncbi:MAG: DUF1015 family protein, partial [Pygmaiobacter sp.]